MSGLAIGQITFGKNVIMKDLSPCCLKCRRVCRMCMKENNSCKKMNKLLWLVMLLILFLPAADHSQTEAPFPFGWRAAEKSDYSAENLSFMNNRVPNHVRADINGDGTNDDAWILINEKENKYGLFIFLARKGGGYESAGLAEYRKETEKLYMGISLMKPGRYKTACGKGYGNCGPNDPKEIVLRNPSINFFAFESANSVFFWDQGKKGFTRIWLSD